MIKRNKLLPVNIIAHITNLEYMLLLQQSL